MTRVKKTVLLWATDNPKGRMFVQEGDMGYVLSECCIQRINESVSVPGYTATGGRTGSEVATCTGCNKHLEDATLGFTPNIAFDMWSETSANSWWSWGKFWFGLEEFAMDISNE